MRTGAASAAGRRRHNENNVIMGMGAASTIGTRRHNENDVSMTIAGLWRYGDWRHMAMGCTALIETDIQIHSMQYFAPVNMYYFIFGLMTIFIEKQQNTIKIV